MNKYLFAGVLILMANASSGQKMLRQNTYFKKPLFTVESTLWCSAVENGQPKREVSEAKLGQPLFFWVKLNASGEASNVFQEIAQPVVIKWFRLTGDGATPEWDTSLQLNEAMLQGKKLNSNTVSYQTWASLSNPSRPGVYIVRLVFYDNSPLDCNGSPCEYQIKIDR